MNDLMQLISRWQSPSNIALVKYWGKLPGQRPMNPSLSMTLSRSVTQTTVTAGSGKSAGRIASVNGLPGHPFTAKLQHVLDVFLSSTPALSEHTFTVETANTFPHSTGIASSASGLSAFALCLLDIASQASETIQEPMAFARTASTLARLGSGSACRSVYGGYTVWGKTSLIAGSSDELALPLIDRVHPSLDDLHDAILVVSAAPKEVSSTTGHGAMDSHPFRPGRILLANEHLSRILDALQDGDVDELAQVTEAEALALHALIMTSGTWLMKPATLTIMGKIREARQSGMPVWFTLDAGANVHMLYPSGNKEAVEDFIRSELAAFCENGRIIYDQCGTGPEKLHG
jgi:diphosphomevalonate decarboxylase